MWTLLLVIRLISPAQGDLTISGPTGFVTQAACLVRAANLDADKRRFVEVVLERGTIYESAEFRCVAVDEGVPA